MKHDVEMTFSEHIEELRRRVIYALVGLALATGACAFFHKDLFNFLASPYEAASQKLADGLAKDLAADRTVPLTDEEKRDLADQIEKLRHPRIIPGGPATLFTTIILICIVGGFILASPWVIYQAWAFVGIGLHPHERKHVYIYGPFSFFLFIGGAGFSFFALRLALQALMSIGIGYRVVDNVYTLDAYVKFLAWMTLAFGLAFQTPLVVLFLAKTRIVPFRTLVRNQRTVILIMAILAAVLTPGTDPISMASLGIPLVVLYEFGLILAWFSDRRQRRRDREAGYPDYDAPEDEAAKSGEESTD